MPRILAVVHARNGAPRHPGDVLAPLGDGTVLGWTLARLTRAHSPQQIVVATTQRAVDDPISRQCRTSNVTCYRGQESDALSLVHAAANCFAGDYVAYVDGRQVLVDPAFLDRAVEQAVGDQADYVGYRYQDGRAAKGAWLTFFTEAVSREALARADREVVGQRERELVTPGIFDFPQWYALQRLPVPAELDDALLRTHDDVDNHMEVLAALVKELGPQAIAATAEQVLHCCRQWPKPAPLSTLSNVSPTPVTS